MKKYDHIQNFITIDYSLGLIEHWTIYRQTTLKKHTHFRD